MNEIKVGLLALVTMASVVYMSLKVTSNQSGFGEYITYRTIVSDASGIFPKTPIRIAGINAGKINKIELADNNALITFEVLERVVISKDSRLNIKTVGFLGDKYLEIIVGDSTERLKQFGFIPAQQAGGMENLIRDVSEVMTDVKTVVGSIKDALAPKGQEPPLKKIMNDMETLVENTKDVTGNLKEFLGENRSKLDGLINNLEKMSKNLAYQTDKTKDDSAMGDVKVILGSMKKMTDDLQNLVADVRAGKGTVGKLLVEEEIADEVQQTLAGVKRLVGRVDQIRTELEVYSGVNTDNGASSELGLRIFPSPERFYLLGLVTSEFGPESERHTTTITNGVSSNEVRKVRDKDSYRFNIQLGRKIQSWTFRGGLIESSGGLAVDYEFSDWGSKFSLEIFDYREEIGPNVRLISEIQLYNVFYGKIAGEDLAEDSRSLTLSAGLKFTDEDLKGLIGFFL